MEDQITDSSDIECNQHQAKNYISFDNKSLSNSCTYSESCKIATFRLNVLAVI